MEKTYTEEFLNSIEEAMEDEDFVTKLKETQNADEIKAAFLGKGIEIDDVIANSAFEKLDYLRNGGELTAEELEMVAGGKKKTPLKGFCTTVSCAALGGLVGGPAGVVAGALIGTGIFLFG